MADHKPIVGISTGTKVDSRTGDPFGLTSLNRDYSDRVIGAGGIPLIIPPGADGRGVADILDGWIISGGNDIDSRHFGQTPHGKNSADDPRRFDTEKEIWTSIRQKLPVLGICYGCQFLNVVLGGSLIQHLPDVVGDDKHTGNATQAYTVAVNSKLARILGGCQAAGCTSHHQAVDELGEGLRVSATHEDGTVEAIETDDDRWVIGVQWHPERSDTPTSIALFHEFVNACRQFKETKNTCDTW